MLESAERACKNSEESITKSLIVNFVFVSDSEFKSNSVHKYWKVPSCKSGRFSSSDDDILQLIFFSQLLNIVQVIIMIKMATRPSDFQHPHFPNYVQLSFYQINQCHISITSLTVHQCTFDLLAIYLSVSLSYEYCIQETCAIT